MIPWQLKNAARSVISFPRRRKAKQEFCAIECAVMKEPIVSFGGVLQQKWIHGGAVKLLSLRDGFTNHEAKFNLLYLVSSALPEFAEDLVEICRAKGIRFVWNQNGVAYPAWAKSESERFNGPMRRLRAQADYIVYQSEFCRVSADKFLGAVEVPHSTLFNPVNLEQFRPAAPLPDEPLRLLAAGTHGYRERVTTVLDTLQVLRERGINATLTLAGKMEWRNAQIDISNWIESRDLPVQILPAFSQAQAVQLYQTHHVLIHPKYLDPCPTVVVEALASGLPVVGSDSGGMPEMLSKESGRLISVPLDWKKMHTPTGVEMADAVQVMLPQLAAASGAARCHALKTFDRVQWVQAHRKIFSNLRRE